MARINYDPFPYAQPDDFVHREIVGRDYTIRAVVEDPEGCMLVESSFIYQGHAFEITKVTESPSAIGTCLIEIVGFERMMQPEDRLEWLAKVREMFAGEPRIRPD